MHSLEAMKRLDCWEMDLHDTEWQFAVNHALELVMERTPCAYRFATPHRDQNDARLT